MIELLSDPSIWLGFLALVSLEIILGIDNLVFIAILANKLPPHQRSKSSQSRAWSSASYALRATVCHVMACDTD